MLLSVYLSIHEYLKSNTVYAQHVIRERGLHDILRVCWASRNTALRKWLKKARGKQYHPSCHRRFEELFQRLREGSLGRERYWYCPVTIRAGNARLTCMRELEVVIKNERPSVRHDILPVGWIVAMKDYRKKKTSEIHPESWGGRFLYWL